MSAAALEARDLCKSFGALRVADHVSLAFAPRRLHGLIGPNGAGKTTLVNLLSGALKPDSGTVALDGRDVTKLSLAGRSRVGLARTFQTAAILPEYTVEENVAFAAQARAGSSFRFFGRVGAEAGLRAQARATLERVGLAGRAASLAGALSHGERRVLEIASALALDPRALLLDEPFAGLGEEDTEAGIRLIASLKRDLTLVLIEHDVAAVFALADDVSVLAQGRVLASGTPQQVRDNPEVRAAYFGEEEAV